ncbi:phosphoadenosine phosphosulfate reductase domain-containing protein [Bacillus sp. FSL K6-2839]|uniref:phosphoadenosine phosphosulfate reductase domain-containing protein n=1 Tax=Bacillus sp. FSL K6-2839 TaxID=2921480 RepID=UPI0030F8204B
MKHIVFYSGGIGSWATAKRVIKQHGKENIILLFTDTLIEDTDLYRFIDQTVKEMDVKFVRIEDGRTPWEVFKDVRYLGNSRLAQCSHILKQKTSEKWLKDNFKPEECILYLGIDWTEEHRTKAPGKHWHPYHVEFPMCKEPYVTKDEMLKELESLRIEQPRLYKMGFSHNNCGGFCVRAGQGHFANLLKQMPDLYKYHENKEEEMRKFLNKDVSILRRTRNGKRFNLTLKQLREELESNQRENVDMNDIGGCGCFVNFD